MEKQIKKALIEIADQLDRLGHFALADKLDQEVIRKLAQEAIQSEQSVSEEIEIPEDEKEMLKEILFSLQESLK